MVLNFKRPTRNLQSCMLHDQLVLQLQLMSYEKFRLIYDDKSWRQITNIRKSLYKHDLCHFFNKFRIVESPKKELKNAHSIMVTLTQEDRDKEDNSCFKFIIRTHLIKLNWKRRNKDFLAELKPHVPLHGILIVCNFLLLLYFNLFYLFKALFTQHHVL